jgi:hypothetical protein
MAKVKHIVLALAAAVALGGSLTASAAKAKIVKNPDCPRGKLTDPYMHCFFGTTHEFNRYLEVYLPGGSRECTTFGDFKLRHSLGEEVTLKTKVVRGQEYAVCPVPL